MKAKNPMVIHYVHDMDRAKTFYTDVFDVKPSFESPGWTTLDFGGIQLALHILPAGDDGLLPNAGLNLEVDNIEEIQADVEKLRRPINRAERAQRWCAGSGGYPAGLRRQRI